MDRFGQISHYLVVPKKLSFLRRRRAITSSWVRGRRRIVIIYLHRHFLGFPCRLSKRGLEGGSGSGSSGGAGGGADGGGNAFTKEEEEEGKMLDFVPMGDVGDEMGKSYKLIRGLGRREGEGRERGGRGEGEGRERGGREGRGGGREIIS